MTTRTRLMAFAGAAAMLAFASPSAWAQTADTPSGGQAAAPDESEAYSTNDIVVTAQRRAQRLQEVPLSVSALSGTMLEEQRLQTVESFQGSVPNLVYSESNASDPQIRVRGIGSDLDGASLERSVAVFVDDVYLGRAAGGTNDLSDLDRVEVLRGPQGTLYGKNTVGGAINLVSARPSFTPSGNLGVTVGNYDLLETRGMVTGPLGDDVAGRLSFTTRDRDGYNTNLVTGNHVDDLNSVAVRGALLIDVNEDLEVLLSADAYQRRGYGANRHAINIGSPAFAAAAGPDARHNYMLIDGRQDNDTAGVSARVVWSLDSADLTSITSYRESRSDIAVDLGGNRFSRVPGDVSAPFATLNTIEEDARQFSQEVRLTSNIDGPLSYVLGVYLFGEDVDRVEGTVVMPLASPTDQTNVQDGQSRATSYAVFADATYELSPQWSVSGGLRWSRDDKSYEALITGNRFAGLPWTVDESESWDAITPRLTLSFEPTDDQLLYATVSRGFKSGGWDGQPTSQAAARLPVDPEYVWNYEIGAKTSWLDGDLVLNAAAFYMDYTDLQVFTLTQPPGQIVPVSALVNAGSARNSGVELELSWRITENTSIQANYGYLDTEITSDLMLGAVNVNGNQFTRAPEHSFGVNASQTFPISSALDLTFRAGAAYTDEFYYNLENNAAAHVDAYTLYNASIDLTPSSDDWRISLWGQNLTDEEYPTHIITAANTGFARFGAPLTYGVTLSYDFN